MIFVSHAQGNAFVRGLLAGLRQEHYAMEFFTTLGFSEDEAWIKKLPENLSRTLSRRCYPIDQGSLSRQPWREIARLMPRWPGFSHLQRHEKGWASLDRVQQALDARVATKVANTANLSAVYTYEDGAESSLRAARKRGVAGFYDLPIGYWRSARRIFEEEAELNPAWANTLGGLGDSPEKLARKDRELELATHIVVASSFTRQTLTVYPEPLNAPISVVPYGAPPAIAETTLKTRLHNRTETRLRVLFVGGLSQRKGLSYLFDSARELKKMVSLTVVGRRPASNCPALNTALETCEYHPSLPPKKLFELMANHDVLVLPSLFEGYGLVLLEAMAQGLPIIATPHTAAPDLIKSGHAGYITPIRDTQAISEALLQIATDPDKREELSFQARSLAHDQDWKTYGIRLTSLLPPKK